MNDSLNHPITEDDIAQYLGNSPDFFERHAELLAAVLLTSPHSKRAVSLQERQAELLREKIKVLEHRIMDMIRHGNENVMLADKMLVWTRALLQVQQVQNLPDLVLQGLADQFCVPQVALKLWGLSEAAADSVYVQGVSDDAKTFAASLTEPFCGLNTGFEVVNWLAEPGAAMSLALLPLRDNAATAAAPTFGLLVLASPDTQRFHSGMGTDFLSRVAELVSAALSRLR